MCGRITLKVTSSELLEFFQVLSGWQELDFTPRYNIPPTSTVICVRNSETYSPYGHGLFGNMICFRANKSGYLSLPSEENFEKDDYFDVMDTVSEMVQETYLCSEFERRKAGTGYRG